jgi:GT2 family glycosyltransferase
VTAPPTTVVVPTADRPAELGRCLEALARMDYPRDRLEVIVVDDAGTADVAAVCRASAGRLRVRLVRHAVRRGPGAARNTGAQAARGDVLAFTDDDCLPDRDWLTALTGDLAHGTAVGGRTRNGLRHNSFADASQHIVDLVYAHYNRDPSAARFFASNNLAVPRADFLAIGGFDDAQFPFAAEDRDFCDRWRASGRALRFAPDALVRHAHDLSLNGFVRQHVAYGRGAARFHRARARRGTGRLRDEVPFHFNGSLWARTLRLRPARRAIGMVALLSLWQATNAAGYVLERER